MTGVNIEGPMEPVVIDGRFRLLAKLGGGGMGLVWRAYDMALQREVALKEVRSDDATQPEDGTEAARQRERVLREARALARLQHPNVVTIFHVVDTPELRHPWLVMELVTGGSLQDLLRHGPRPPAEVARIGRGVLAALVAAHQAGIQHRDVKPGNVLLRPDGTPVLTDFGIAALQGSTQLTATGSVIGSPEFIAPERLRGVEGDPSSDLWSLGIMLYAAVEGHNPMHRPTTVATLAAVLDGTIPPPVQAGPLAPVLAGLLQRDPAARLRAEAADRMLADAASPVDGARSWQQQQQQQQQLPQPQPYPQPYPHAQPQSWYPAQAASRAGAPVSQRGGSRTATSFAVAVALVAAAGLGGALFWATRSHANLPSASGAGGSQPSASGASAIASTSGTSTATASPSTSASAGGSGGLLTPAGIEAFVRALPSLVGTTKVYQLVLYPDFADFEAPAKSQPGAYDDYIYKDGRLSSEPGEDLDEGEKSVDLTTIDWSVIPGLVKKSTQVLKVTNPTDHYVIVDPNWDFASGTALLVYCSNDYGGGYLAADIHGKILDTFPAGS
jgi:serine/threonine protein kinase